MVHALQLRLSATEDVMPRGSKAKYTTKQKRRAEHIEEGYERRGVSSGEAARRAWATVNKEEGGGKKSGSGRGKKPNRSAARKGGKAASRSRSPAARKGGTAAARRRSAAARKGGKAAARARRTRSRTAARNARGGRK
jgi:hypothetical protein